MPTLNRSISPVTAVVATGIGAALFFVFGRFVAIPLPIPNTSVNFQYALLAVFAFLFGPVVASLMGLIGHALIDVSLYGPWWSWIIASAIAGLVMGLIMVNARRQAETNEMRSLARFNVGIVLANLVAWVVVAPSLDIIIYSEPASKVFTQGAAAFVANSLTACIVGSILLVAYFKTLTKEGSLRAQD